MNMNIQVLGTGCPKCKLLENATREAISMNNIDAVVTKIEKESEIMKYTTTIPALIIDGELVLKGRVPSMDELTELLINKVSLENHVNSHPSV